MGKASRLRQQRAAALAARSARAPLSMLATALEAIGDAYGEVADCARASAFLQLTAHGLGYELEPRQVSLVAKQLSTENIMVMGVKGMAAIPEKDLDRVENHRASKEETGHMILTSEDPKMLWDANLRQLGQFGVRAPSLGMPIESTHPVEGGWTAKVPDLIVTYILDDPVPSLWDRYEEALELHADDAQILTAMIRDRLTADQIRSRMNSNRHGG